MTQSTLLDPKDPQEVVPLTWEFTDGAVPASASVSVSVVEGADGGAASMLYGAVQITNGIVIQLAQGGLHGVTYKFKAAITMTDGTRFVHAAILPVQNA